MGALHSNRVAVRNQSLRLRLERAYISTFLTNIEPGSEILAISVNRSTGLPSALIEAVSIPDKFHENIPGIPLLAKEERISQVVNIKIASSASSANLLELLTKSQLCITSPPTDGLATISSNGSLECRMNWPTGEKWLASTNAGTRALIECHEALIGCSLSMPFKDFEVKVTFHRSNLRNWQELMAFADSFLTSKLID
jgi:hypothetical protein